MNRKCSFIPQLGIAVVEDFTSLADMRVEKIRRDCEPSTTARVTVSFDYFFLRLFVGLEPSWIRSLVSSKWTAGRWKISMRCYLIVIPRRKCADWNIAQTLKRIMSCLLIIKIKSESKMFPIYILEFFTLKFLVMFSIKWKIPLSWLHKIRRCQSVPPSRKNGP